MDKIGLVKEKVKEVIRLRMFDGKDFAPLTSEKSRQEELLSRIKKVMKGVLKEYRLNPGKEELDKLAERILSDIYGYGCLDDLMKDPLITDVLVNSPSQVFIEKKGELFRANMKFNSVEEIRSIIDRMMIGSGRRIDQFSPFVDFKLTDGSRVTAVIPPVSSSGPAISIRKFSGEVFAPENLVELGTLTRNVLEFLGLAVKARLNILITGSTGVGKTTLMSSLLRFVPNNERIVVIEDTEELSISGYHHFLKLLTRPPSIEGKGEITLRNLVRLSLHLRPDRIVIGEVRGEESFSFLQAINTGHEGSMCTLHANDALDALARIEMLSLMARPNISPSVIRRFISTGIDLVIHLRKDIKNNRIVSQVSEVSLNKGEFEVKDIYNLKQAFVGGEEVLSLNFTGVIPSFTDKLKARTQVKDINF